MSEPSYVKKWLEMAAKETGLSEVELRSGRYYQSGNTNNPQWIVCESPGSLFHDEIPGSDPGACGACGRFVTLAPSSLILRKAGFEIRCVTCAAPYLAQMRPGK